MPIRSYSQRVRDNILPLSVGETLPEAFEEWSFTEDTVDHGEPIETCYLCDHEELRYHFQIRNTFTGHTLWVGSSCILKFGLSVFEDGQLLSPRDAKRKLERITQKMRLDSCLKALNNLCDEEGGEILSGALAYYEKNKFLTPKHAFVVLWRLKHNRIDHSPSFFKVTLKKDRHKSDLRQMPTERVHMIWPALSTSQRKMAVEMGHLPPPA